MKISEQWLREWAPVRLDTRALAQRLTLGGLPVDAVLPVAGDLSHVVVGEILALAPHPQAESLRLCQVDVGKAKALEIVCAASNAAPGIKAPVALPGAALANGAKVQSTVIRGVASAGMLCSAAELGLAESAEGLLILGPEAKPGTPLARYLETDDHQLEIDITPNRGDCLSVAGVARELAALTGTRLRPPKTRAVAVKSRRRLAVALKAAKDCPHYVGRVITGINAAATTPVWMQERLRRSGLRSIHPVVDVTNYVMLELGQPMHAFDMDKLSGGIEARHARKDESLVLLDGNTLKLPAGALLIADRRAPLALAGIMGGQASGVTAQTRDIFLESAYFRPETIAQHARALSLQTESSYRFERGVDPQLQRRAMERASALLRAIVGGDAGPIIETAARPHLPKPPTILLRAGRIQRLLGYTPSAKQVPVMLKRLGMRVQAAAQGWRVTPPSYRADIKREADLIEEIARLDGYHKVPSRMPQLAMAAAAMPEARVSERRLRTVLIARDYHEVISYSFVDPALESLLNPHVKPLLLANPIAANMAAMRTSLWPGLLQALVYNLNRQQTRVRLFEIGRRFLPEGAGLNHDKMLAGVATGPAEAEQWAIPSRALDFYDVKGDVEALLPPLHQAHEGFLFQPTQNPILHPGQAAEIRRDGKVIGRVGMLHPALQRKLDLRQPVFLFELELAAIQTADLPVFREISKFPSIRRDLSIIVDENVTARAVLDCITEAAGELLVYLEFFDQYRGEGVDSGRKSLALGLTLQDSSRTLTEEAVETVITQVVSAVQSRLGGQLRQ